MAKNKGLHKSKVWLSDRYINKRMTLAQMSAEAGVSIEMINSSLRKHGIK